MTLRGPAHPDTFRVQVGRYGDRWYCDPLPLCPIADATEDQWPSVSIVKNAWPKSLGHWQAAEAAKFAVEHREQWVGLPADAAVEMISKASDRTRDRAADRGTEVHRLLEQIADGDEPSTVWVPDAAPYLPVLRQLVADLSPTWIASEVVCISRTLGYGGTSDAVIRVGDDVPELGGKILAVDWKSRKPGRHDAHRDECAQLAAYARCDYIIVERDGQARRETPPPVDGGLIVSITPEDYRLYPLDLDAAWQTFVDLRGFWDTTKRVVRGRHLVVPRRPVPDRGVPSQLSDPFDGLTPMANAEASQAGAFPKMAAAVAMVTEAARGSAPGPAADPLDAPPPGVERVAASPERWSWMRGRVLAIVAADPNVPIVWPEGVAPLKPGNVHTDDELDLIAEALVPWEAKLQLSFPAEDPGRVDVPPPEPKPEPAPPVQRVARDDADVAALRSRVLGLPPDLLAELEAAAVTGQGIPRLDSGRATPEQVATVVALLEPLEERAADRRDRRDLALSLAQANGLEPIAALHLVAPDVDADRLCEWELDDLDALSVAAASGKVVAVDSGALVVADGAEEHLKSIHGGRSGINAAARQIAERRSDLDGAPRSTADVLASPLWAARVEMSETA